MGIGKTLARAMAKRGAKVVLNGRNKERLQKTLEGFQKEGYPMIAVSGDVSIMEDCQKLVTKTIEQFGKLDVIINNAGLSMKGEIEDLDPSVFKKIMEVNFLGSVYPTKSALPHLKKTKGSVIFIGSVAGIHGIPNFSVYSASKMALTAIAEALKTEQHPNGVHVGIAYVGFTENDPDKVIYDTDGKIIAQPKNNVVKAESPEVVAQRIIKMIERRRFKWVFSTIGKLNAIMNRISPTFVNWVLRKNYYK